MHGDRPFFIHSCTPAATGRGTVLQTLVNAPVYESPTYGDAPYLDSVLIWNQEHEELTLFAVNKHLQEDMEICCDLRQFDGYQIAEHQVLTHTNLKAVNTETSPLEVAPVSGTNAELDLRQAPTPFFQNTAGR